MRLHTIIFLTAITTGIANSQDSCLIKATNWMSRNNVNVRKTFDGSKNENKPAGLIFREDYLSENEYFNIDIALKISEFELFKNSGSSLVFYPKIEWHRSTDSLELKNKLDAGINLEFLPFPAKFPNIPQGLPNRGLLIAPWLQVTSSFKRNLINNVNELKLVGQLSFISNYKYLPGYLLRDSKKNLRFIYYPYFGIEHNKIPDLFEKRQVESVSFFLVRLYCDIWIVPQSVQLNIDGMYRRKLSNNEKLRKNMPLLCFSINLYPGKQEAICIGYEYKHGYDSDSSFKFIQVSSIRFNIKL